MKTITQYTVQEVLNEWSKHAGAEMTQSDLARALNMNRQQIGALKTKPIPTKYNDKIENLLNMGCTVQGDQLEINYWDRLPAELKNPKIVSVWFDREIIENAWGMKADHLCIIPMIGDKMMMYWYPIRNGDILIIDTNQAKIMGNGVYFATSQNNTRFWIREMQVLINNDIQIKGFAPSGDTVKVFSNEQLKEVDFQLIGKVIKNVSFRL